jgi:hypothetical protein
MAVGDEPGFKGNATGQSTHTKTVLREPAHKVGSAPGIIAVQKCVKHLQAFMVSHRRIRLLTPKGLLAADAGPGAADRPLLQKRSGVTFQ